MNLHFCTKIGGTRLSNQNRWDCESVVYIFFFEWCRNVVGRGWQASASKWGTLLFISIQTLYASNLGRIRYQHTAQASKLRLFKDQIRWNLIFYKSSWDNQNRWGVIFYKNRGEYTIFVKITKTLQIQSGATDLFLLRSG